ncbi:hypothetical protein PAAG_11781 [Paracoccidioides lutzii Pb01]|uniref:Uncharacterized protein n=1 Tax=Paracoccidioides lutzii (strain ATCC MYA-826 / Pb01) TaxID=502779 RepID=A0A0A2V220_PARBA|nr:hypothetical protein PAAG_11781 [Paracoccidioides lutzii Pb01]KGQ01543.1 hypothetical protein PAAG_11781 [Paracoccidioides lutzii Pb01]
MSRPDSLSIFLPDNDSFELPMIADDKPVAPIIKKLSDSIIQAIPVAPYSFDQMWATTA